MNPDLSQVQRHVAQVFHADEVALLGASRLQEVLVGDGIRHSVTSFQRRLTLIANPSNEDSAIAIRRSGRKRG